MILNSKKVKEALEKKYANPFTAIEAFDLAAYKTIITECQEALTRVSEDVKAYNQKLTEKDSLRCEIDSKNIQLAYHENKAWIDNIKSGDYLNWIEKNYSAR